MVASTGPPPPETAVNQNQHPRRDARLAKISVRNETPKILKSSALKYWDSGPPVRYIARGRARLLQKSATAVKCIPKSTRMSGHRRQERPQPAQTHTRPAPSRPFERSIQGFAPACRQILHSGIFRSGNVPVNFKHLFPVAAGIRFQDAFEIASCSFMSLNAFDKRHGSAGICQQRFNRGLPIRVVHASPANLNQPHPPRF